jgi:predicted DNA-binding transcriptional regulator AlpA
MSNPNPDTSGFRAWGKSPIAWEEAQIDEFIRRRIKGQSYKPIPLSDHPTLIRKPEVLRRTGLSYASVWKLERDGKFPRRVRIVPARGEESADAAAD